MPIPTLEERLSTTLGGRYRVDRELARGGMSVIFAGRDLRAHRGVAIKLLRPGDALDERRLARFARETELTARLRHPNIVDVFDLGREPDGTPYLVMELLRGQTLASALENERVMSLARLLEILLPVMNALTRVHEAGVVHRDLKPDNVFLSTDSRGALVPKLLDFGIAKHCDDGAGTRTGAVMGTPEYMAPEQIAGTPALPTTDVWAVGAILYRGLTGKAPYAGASPGAVLARLSHEPAPLMAADDVPAAVRAVIDRALLRDPALRYPDVDQFARALTLSATEAGIAVAKIVTDASGARGSPASEGAHTRTFTASATLGFARGARRPRTLAVAAVAGALFAGWLAQRTATQATSQTQRAASGDISSRRADAPGRVARESQPGPIAAGLTLSPAARTELVRDGAALPTLEVAAPGGIQAATLAASARAPTEVRDSAFEQALAAPTAEHGNKTTSNVDKARGRRTRQRDLGPNAETRSPAVADEARALPLATRW